MLTAGFHKMLPDIGNVWNKTALMSQIWSLSMHMCFFTQTGPSFLCLQSPSNVFEGLRCHLRCQVSQCQMSSVHFTEKCTRNPGMWDHDIKRERERKRSSKKDPVLETLGHNEILSSTLVQDGFYLKRKCKLTVSEPVSSQLLDLRTILRQRALGVEILLVQS